MSRIAKIEAREILSSGGSPTIEATVTLESGIYGSASVAFGASAGKHEAVTLVDGDPNRYEGKGMLKAIDNIDKIIQKEVVGMEAGEQRAVDQKMIELDGTENKADLGGNAILAVSLAVARAAAEEQQIALYRYLGKNFQIVGDSRPLPKPMAVMIEGGKHAENSTDFQEYLIEPLAAKTSAEGLEIVMKVYAVVRTVLEKRGLSINTGNEGAFAPEGIESNEKALEILMEAITASGMTAGKEVGLSIDAAASEFYDSEGKIYDLRREQKKLTADEMVGYYLGLIKKYPIKSLEDPLGEDDWDNWVKLNGQLGLTINIADDLTVTNMERLKKAMEMKAASGVIIKLNQAGTLSETVDCCLLAKERGWMVIPSHRGGGETADTFMVDLAVAVGADYIKVGPTRGERVEKYNRLMEIEAEIGKK